MKSIVGILAAGILSSASLTSPVESPAVRAAYVTTSSYATDATPAYTGADDCSKPVDLVRVAAITPEGSEVAPIPGDGLGRRYYYNVDGTILSQTIPPGSFNPLQATPAELALYDFPPRPTDPSALASWALLKPGTPGMCAGTKVNALTVGRYSPNWAGGMSVNGSTTNNTYSESVGDWDQTGFVDQSGCGGVSGTSYSSWSGLGGWNNDKLMQSGTDTSTSTLNGIYAFWEMIDPSHENPEVIFSGSSVAPGDTVETVTLDQGGDTSGSDVLMEVVDETTNNYWSSGYVFNYAGDPTMDYYDGSTVDFITEAPQESSGSYYNLRKPALGNTLYTVAEPNGQPLSTYTSNSITETVGGTSYGTPIQTTTFNGSAKWYDSYSSCLTN